MYVEKIMIQKVQSSNQTFQAARVNILATADNHGNILRLPRVLKTIENNAGEFFPKSESPSTKNFFAIVGDWFINPSKKGFVTHPDLSNGDIQNLALLKTIDSVRMIVKNLAEKAQGYAGAKIPSLETLFVMGNHCLDAGDKFILSVMKKNPMTSVVTNANLEKSPALVEAMKEDKDIVKSAVYSVPDDKNSELFHKILFVSATIPSMDFYNPGLLKGLEFYDNSNKKDTNLKEADIQGTIKSIKDEVDKFKEANPKGVVVLLSHMGGRLSEIVRENVPQINHILNGHDHKNLQANVGKTSINSLGKDNEMIKALNLEFDDEGNLIKGSMTPYFTETTLADGLENHPFQLFLNDFFRDDMKPLVSLDEWKTDRAADDKEQNLSKKVAEILDRMGLNSWNVQRETLMQNKYFKEIIENKAMEEIVKSEEVDRGMTELSYGNEIRYKNSYLMNYLTSAVKRAVRKNCDPDIFTVALQSSIVCGGLKDNANNLEVMKVFDGVSEDLSNLKMGEVKGFELVGLITENILSNLKAPTRNTIIHWSDVQVNRSLIKEIRDGNSDADYADAIRVRNKITKAFEPIDLNENYKMVIGEKFLVKDDIAWPGKIRDRFKSLDKTYDQLFRDYIESVNYELHITPKTKEERIL